MALTRRQMACLERNGQFLDEVAAALLAIASQMKRGAMVIVNTAESTAVQRAFAEATGRIADQILAEQGISLQAANSLPGIATTATGGSTAMRYLVQQLLMSPGWTLTPDAWAADEGAARAAIQAGMAALLANLTAIPS